jgi:hypothetical protein
MTAKFTIPSVPNRTGFVVVVATMSSLFLKAEG